MRILPILFSTDMVLAILDGKKTVTRRTIKQEKVSAVLGSYARKENPEIPDENFINCLVDAPYEQGDILYVRETWCEFPKDTFHYRADNGERDNEFFEAVTDTKWKPSIHMPKVAARIWLKVDNVKVERLHDISNEQILSEGANKGRIASYIRQMAEDTEEWTRAAYLLEWSNLWDDTVKADWQKWENNPWVWVIEFERCEKPRER